LSVIYPKELHPMSSATIGDDLTVGGVASMFGVTRQQARTVIDRLGAARRVGVYRIIPGDQLPRIEAALIGGGFLKPEQRNPGNANAPAAGPR
jgi:hypothetical protein